MLVHRVEVVRRLPHPERGFTQGLIAEANGTVLESVGLYGQSQLRRYRLGVADITERTALAADFFGEGICLAGNDVWQLTWRERRALRWDARTLELRDVVSYNREGWGICAVGDEVITSDGTSELVRRDPLTLQPRGLIKVRCAGRRVQGLNDLAWAGGRVWGNVAGTTAIVGIDPATGEVTNIIDARAAAESSRGDPQAIMNGIAALPAPGEFLLTGKQWRWIRHVRLAPARPGTSPARLLEGAGQFF
ncbi:MAG TPA: glutaminyl-peptide cyclotransferase [Trebonia sp.]|nr:glutaminyl-peptide cyclotransferase [Trebonia sp.]